MKGSESPNLFVDFSNNLPNGKNSVDESIARDSYLNLYKQDGSPLEEKLATYL